MARKGNSQNKTSRDRHHAQEVIAAADHVYVRGRPDEVARCVRDGNNLVILFKDGRVVQVPQYFTDANTENLHLVFTDGTSQWPGAAVPSTIRAEQASLKFGSLHFSGREPLTRREREVLEQLASGASNKEAGRTLGISPRTIEDHRANIMKKLGARNAADLIRIVMTEAYRTR